MKLTVLTISAFASLTVAALATDQILSDGEASYASDVQFGEYGEVEQSLTGAAGNAEEGAAIFGDKKRGNCVACHLVENNPADFAGSVGPQLDGVGGYRTEAELRGIVVDAKRTFEGSMMPSMYKTASYIRPGDAFTGKAGTEPLPSLLTAEQIEDVVAYLMTLKEE